MATNKTVSASDVLAMLAQNPKLAGELKALMGAQNGSGFRLERARTSDGKALPGLTLFGTGKPRFIGAKEMLWLLDHADEARKLAASITD